MDWLEKRRKENGELFLKECKDKFGNLYDLTKVRYVNNKEKIIIGCPVHGDVEVYKNQFLLNGCPKCSKCKSNAMKRDTKESFINKLYKRFPNFKYDLTESVYVSCDVHMDVVCHEKDENGIEHGSWKITPENLYSGYGCPKCRNERNIMTLRLPYDVYKKSIKDKYGDIYEVNKESYESKAKEVEIYCKKHKCKFNVKTNEFPRYNNHKCPECIKEDLEFKENDSNSLHFDTETWIDIPRFIGKYQCSSEGRIKRINRISKNGNKLDDRILNVSFHNRMGSIKLEDKMYYVHRIVYESFHNIELSKTQTIDHIDSNVRNNNISNLRLCESIKDNISNNKNTLTKLSIKKKKEEITGIYDFENLPNEKWVDALGYEDVYMVSNFGRISSKERKVIDKNGVVKIKRKRLMRQTLKYGQYYAISLVDNNGKRSGHYVHRLVYESFKGKIKTGMEIDHIDSNPINNNIINLREVTPLENARNKNSLAKRTTPKHNLGIKVKKLDLQGNLIKEYISISEAAEENKCNKTSMANWVNNKIDQKNNRMRGYYFEKVIDCLDKKC